MSDAPGRARIVIFQARNRSERFFLLNAAAEQRGHLANTAAPKSPITVCNRTGRDRGRFRIGSIVGFETFTIEYSTPFVGVRPQGRSISNDLRSRHEQFSSIIGNRSARHRSFHLLRHDREMSRYIRTVHAIQNGRYRLLVNTALVNVWHTGSILVGARPKKLLGKLRHK